MKQFKTVNTIILVVAFAVGFFLASGNRAFAKETRIVRIHGGVSFSTKALRLEPDIITVTPGSVVIWNNWAKASDVKVTFKEGKICQDVTEAPMGFSLDARQCYVTSWIPLGGTSSLRFTEAGTYEYVVETTGGVTTHGKIQVQQPER